MTEEVNGVTLQLPEDGHVGFPTAMSGDVSDPEFYLRKSVVRPSAPVRPSARPPIVRPRPLIRPACPPPSAHPLVHSSARPSIRSLVRPACPPLSAHPLVHSSARPSIRPLVRLCTRPPVRSPCPPRSPHIIRGP